jgi:hypothetical protein
MKKTLAILLILTGFVSAYSQDNSNIINTFIANFEKASVDIKLQVLQDAASTNLQDCGPLFQKALDYIISNANQLKTQLPLRGIGQYAITQIQKIKYSPARNVVWSVFLLDQDSYTRVSALSTLRDIAADDPKMVENVNKWLDGQNEIYRTGKPVDYQVIVRCVQVLGDWGSTTSFPVIFKTMNLALNEDTVAVCEKAMKSIKGDIKQLYIQVIMNDNPANKKKAIEKILNSPDFKDVDKAEIAVITLNSMLHSTVDTKEDRMFAIEVRGIAVRALSQRNWTNATDLIIEHFNQTLVEFEKGLADKRYVLEAIAALGNMKSHEAAKRLTLYLDLINTYTENGRTYDEQIVMAVLNSLKTLGDNVATGSLLYTKYLNYSETVRKAVNEALQGIK